MTMTTEKNKYHMASGKGGAASSKASITNGPRSRPHQDQRKLKAAQGNSRAAQRSSRKLSAKTAANAMSIDAGVQLPEPSAREREAIVRAQAGQKAKRARVSLAKDG